MRYGKPTHYSPDGTAYFNDGAVCRARDWLAYMRGEQPEPVYHLPKYTPEQFWKILKATDFSEGRAKVGLFDPPLWVPDEQDWECGTALMRDIFQQQADREAEAITQAQIAAMNIQQGSAVSRFFKGNRQ